MTYKDKYPNLSPNNDYVGHITYLYIGEYDRKFTGNVAPTDRDSRISKGDFFEIEEIYDELIEPHKQGLMRYFNIHEAVVNLNELPSSCLEIKIFPSLIRRISLRSRYFLPLISTMEFHLFFSPSPE